MTSLKIKHTYGPAGGYLVGNSHAENGIKGIVGAGKKPIEMQGGEVVITAPAVEDTDLREFDGEMLTNREILSRINVSGGGISFAEGGEVPETIMTTGKTYKFGGNVTPDHDIVKECGCKHRHMKTGGIVNPMEHNKDVQKGYAIEKNEHQGTLNDLYHHNITTEQAISQLVDKHLAENSEYYEGYALGGVTEQESGWDLFKEFNSNIQTLKAFVSRGQIGALIDIYKGEERAAAIEIAKRLVDNFLTMPRTYQTEGIQTEDKILYLHYFSASMDWYIAERDMEEEQLQAFGFGTNGAGDEEWGYISLEEFKTIPQIEIDFHFTPIKFSELFSEKENIDLTDNAIPVVPIVAQQDMSVRTAKQQAEINNQIRALIASKGINRLQYSAEELSLLQQYEGAGGLIKQGETGTGILDQFFTPVDICAKMWGLAIKYGFQFKDNVRICEPAVGGGRFLKFIPTNVNLTVTAFDIEEISYSICKILYPQYEIIHDSFESLFFSGRRHIGLVGLTQQYDLVIGNPPYREYASKYAPLGERDATGAYTFEMYFISRGIDILKPGGLLVFIIPNSFMSNDNKYNDFKISLEKKADLLKAYRLPNGVFGNTDVGTDIVVFKKKG